MIELYSTDTRVINLTEEALSGQVKQGAGWQQKVRPFELYSVPHKELPKHADYVVTPGQLNAGLERFSAALGAMPVVLPEGGEYLAQKAAQARQYGDTLTLIGSDYRRVKF